MEWSCETAGRLETAAAARTANGVIASMPGDQDVVALADAGEPGGPEHVAPHPPRDARDVGAASKQPKLPLLGFLAQDPRIDQAEDVGVDAVVP